MNKRKEFSEWLTLQIQERDWSFREFARRADTTIGTVSRVINLHQDPTDDFCRGIARALNLPEETVFRRAGLLPPEPDNDADAKEALHLFRQMTPTQRQIMLTQMRALVRRERITERRRGTPTG